MSNPDSIYRERRERVYSYLESGGIEYAILSDNEKSRNKSTTYLTGHPSDCVLILSSAHEATLIPWDINLATKHASADQILPLGNFERNLKRIVEELILPSGKITVELSSLLSFPLVTELKESYRGINFVCREEGIDNFIGRLRESKDSHERTLLKKACEITNETLEILYRFLKEGYAKKSGTTEIDVALFIERTGRKLGSEGTGFESLVASSARSHEIHPYPEYSNTNFFTRGLAVIDFGFKYGGYTSDVTLPIAIGQIQAKQRDLLDRVTGAYRLALEKLKENPAIGELAASIDSYFEASGLTMPHSLGHGIGLDAHELPLISTSRRGKSNSGEESPKFREGSVITIEPGLYDPELGGARLENDFLITYDSKGSGEAASINVEELTFSKPLFL